jgi:hypothetical protein
MSEEMTEEAIKDPSVTREHVTKLIDDKRIYDWNPDTIKKVISGSGEATPTKKAD